jgi:purine-nucleoside phosphorylase
MTPEHPLRGKNDERFGPICNMSEPYSRKMIAKATEIAKELNIEVQEGIYLGLQGLLLKLLQNTKWLKPRCRCGMSTVPEVIVARTWT